MSPFVAGFQAFAKSFPRVSGDEPPTPEVTAQDLTFSPRERG